MHATFIVGLVAHALGMALFFFYAGVLEKCFKERKGVILLSVLFTLIILTHIVAAFAAAMLLISYFIMYFSF